MGSAVQSCSVGVLVVAVFVWDMIAVRNGAAVLAPADWGQTQLCVAHWHPGVGESPAHATNTAHWRVASSNHQRSPIVDSKQRARNTSSVSVRDVARCGM